jgi:hypothetical protein
MRVYPAAIVAREAEHPELVKTAFVPCGPDPVVQMVIIVAFAVADRSTLGLQTQWRPSE